MSAPPFSFPPVEIRSYLPSGWGLVDEHGGRWDGRRAAWSIEVYDPADNTWRLEVRARDAASLGRLPALQRAIDALHRAAVR